MPENSIETLAQTPESLPLEQAVDTRLHRFIETLLELQERRRHTPEL